MSVGNVSGIDSIKALRAKQAFERTNKLSENKELLQNGFNEEDIKLSISSKEINIPKQKEAEPEKVKKDDFMERHHQYVGEIKNFINKNNYQVVEEEDIKNAITYGRSILADYTA